MIEFLQRYFIDPIYQHSGYNVVNTLVYGVLLGVGIILTQSFVAKLKIDIDRRFFLGFLPFLILASFLRSLVDAKLLPTSFLLVTPGIFLTIFFIAFIALVLGLFLESRSGIDYYRAMLSIGLITLVYPISAFFPNVYTFKPFLYISIIFILAAFLIIAPIYFKFDALKNRWILGMILAHMLDASATFVGIEYFGYWEEHVFENWLIERVGTALILFPLKIMTLGIIIAVIHSFISEKARNFWYFAFLVLGFSPGLRDTLTIMLIG
jgi:uncharacterized membrane protein